LTQDRKKPLWREDIGSGVALKIKEILIPGDHIVRPRRLRAFQDAVVSRVALDDVEFDTRKATPRKFRPAALTLVSRVARRKGRP
jgi:hypothetical protein